MTLPIYFTTLQLLRKHLTHIALVPSPLPPALPTFASPFLWCCGASWSSLMPWSLSTISKHGILLGRPTWCYTPFLLLILLLSLVCCSPTVSHYYGSALWKLSCSAIHSIEVSFNNILRRIWHLPRNCHTRILHLTAPLAQSVQCYFSGSIPSVICPLLFFSDCSKGFGD